jgi:hypothetical protein
MVVKSAKTGQARSTDWNTALAVTPGPPETGLTDKNEFQKLLMNLTIGLNTSLI